MKGLCDDELLTLDIARRTYYGLAGCPVKPPASHCPALSPNHRNDRAGQAKRCCKCNSNANIVVRVKFKVLNVLMRLILHGRGSFFLQFR